MKKLSKEKVLNLNSLPDFTGIVQLQTYKLGWGAKQELTTTKRNKTKKNKEVRQLLCRHI